MKKQLNNKFYQKIHVRIGQKVKVISGQYKGKIGRIKKIIRSQSKVIVEDVNFKIKHIKSKNQEESGSIKRMEFPIHSSNVIGLEE